MTRPSSCQDQYFPKTRSLWDNKDSNPEELLVASEEEIEAVLEAEIEAASVEEIVEDSVVALEEAIEVVSAAETEEVSEVHPGVGSDETITNSN